MSVLGAMMIDPNALIQGLTITEKSDYYRPTHQDIYESLLNLFERKEPVDLITLQEELRRVHKLEECGGTEYLMALVDSVPTSANVVYYANIVRQKAIARKHMELGVELISWASNEEPDIESRAVQGLLDIKAQAKYQARHVNDVIDTLSKSLEARERGETPPRVPFSLSQLTKALKGGPAMGDLVVVGADTSHGKTILLTDLAKQGLKAGVEVLLVTLEMTDEQYLTRFMCSNKRIDSAAMEAAEIPWSEIALGFNDFFDSKLTFWEKHLSITELELQTQRWLLEKGCTGNGLLVLDYAGLLKREGRYGDENSEVGDRVRRLKALAKDNRIVVATASQFRKEIAGTRKPRSVDTLNMDCKQVPFATLDDLIGSSEIRSSADIVLIGYNPPEAVLNEQEMTKAFWLIAKHRNGKAGGRYAVWFEPKYTLFTDIDWRQM